VSITVTHALSLFLIFCAALLYRIQQTRNLGKVHYSADRDVVSHPISENADSCA